MIKSNFLLRHKRAIIILGVLCILVGIGVGITLKMRRKSVFAKASEMMQSSEYAEVKSGDISLSITGSGAIESSNTKNIASEVSAKVEQVNVKVGDKVSKGDVLFVLDSSDLDSQIRNKEKTVSSYQKSINNYQKSVNEYKEDITNLNVVSDVSGYVKNLKVGVGDTVNKNDVIFEVIDNSTYQVEVNLYYFEASPVRVGDVARMMLNDSYVYVEGEIVQVSDFKEQHTGGGQMQKVVIDIKNPSYTLEGISVRDIEVITESGATVVAVKDEPIEITLKDAVKFRSPSSGKVSRINIADGSYVDSGMLLMVLENDDLQDKLLDVNDSISEVKTSISDTYTDISDLKSDYSFYTIASPIDGVVTSVEVSEGDYVRSESSIATIVNTDKLQFDISVDELDILKLEVGQEARITIDAIDETESEPIIGYVSEIGIVGTNMNSVTSYPVTIALDGREDIMMGMNCSVDIVIENSEDALVIPVEAVNSRKDKYYVTMEDGTEREVEIGIYDEDNIEIVSGLTIGEKVKLPSKMVTKSSSDEENESSFNNGFMGGSSMPPTGGFGGGEGMRNGMTGMRGGF